MEVFDFAHQFVLQSLVASSVWETVKQAVWTQWQPLALEIESIKKTADPAIWLVGSVLALAPGSYVLYKWWYYRDSRLPLRLQELLEKDEARLRGEARVALLSAVNAPSAARATVTPPIFAVPTLKTTIRNLNWSGWRNPFPFATAERELETALDEIEKQLAFGEQSRINCKKQQAVAFIVKGAIAAARASQINATPESTDRDNRAALYDFGRALEIEPTDIEALEYFAHQQRVLGQDGPAISSFERLISLTESTNCEAKLVTARAYRYIGEILEKQYDATRVQLRLTTAKQRLESAFEALPTVAMGQIDHAAVRELQGRLAEKDGATQLPGIRYNQARTIYEAINDKDPTNKEAINGADRMKKALQDFNQDSQRIVN
jgi:hypothetical protein